MLTSKLIRELRMTTTCSKHQQTRHQLKLPVHTQTDRCTHLETHEETTTQTDTITRILDTLPAAT